MDRNYLCIGFIAGFALIVALLWQPLSDPDYGCHSISCVSSPVDEMVTKIQKAQAGMDTSTGAMCMKSGERFSDQALITKMNNLNSVSFNCDSGSAACKSGGPIDVSQGNVLVANSDAKFRALITCTRLQDSSGNFDCTVEIQSV